MLQSRKGFSLVETLVCLAIIMILMAMYLPALSKARRKAEEVSVKEGFRQEAIGRMADSANIVHDTPLPADQIRRDCRAAYRETMETGVGNMLVTRLIYVVQNEAEFRAYWHTLINPSASSPLQVDATGITVYDPENNKFHLPSLGNLDRWVGPPVPVGWEFLSTDLSETSSGTLGCNVLYSDTHMEYVVYPQAFPACPAVAELSHQFALANQ